MNNMNVVVLIPIYAPRLVKLEQLSIDVSVKALKNRSIRFLAPASLDTSYYENRYPQIGYIRGPDQCFRSIPDYSRMLLSEDFYQSLMGFEHLLILQPDAVVLHDQLDEWQDFEYVGAPWPGGITIKVRNRELHATVGNGGLSLRRVSACLKLLQTHKQDADYFRRSGSSEDLFFSMVGGAHEGFRIPDERLAAKFSLEKNPTFYGTKPMGGHGWWKHDYEFWSKLIS